MKKLSIPWWSEKTNNIKGNKLTAGIPVTVCHRKFASGGIEWDISEKYW